MSNKPRDIFEKDPSGLYAANDSLDIGPEPPLVLEPELLPGDGERLAREARRDEIHDPTPWSAVEGGKVVPDRSLIQRRVRHPLHEDGRSVGFPLDVAHSSISRDGEAEPKLKPPNPGT